MFPDIKFQKNYSKAKTNKSPIRNFKYLIFTYVTLSTLLILVTSYDVFITNKLFEKQFCFKAECITYFYSQFKDVVKIFDYLLKTLLTLITIFSIYYALKHYINSTTAAVINIHLTNLNTFKDYVTNEVEELRALNIKRLDFLKWYNLIYPDSREGSLLISPMYEEIIQEINDLIENSNNCYEGKGEENTLFNYKQHQSQMIKKLNKIGISIGRAPRNNFRETEEVIFELVNKVNKEFCGRKGPKLIQKRRYK